MAKVQRKPYLRKTVFANRGEVLKTNDNDDMKK